MIAIQVELPAPAYKWGPGNSFPVLKYVLTPPNTDSNTPNPSNMEPALKCLSLYDPFTSSFLSCVQFDQCHELMNRTGSHCSTKSLHYKVELACNRSRVIKRIIRNGIKPHNKCTSIFIEYINDLGALKLFFVYGHQWRKNLKYHYHFFHNIKVVNLCFPNS